MSGGGMGGGGYQPRGYGGMPSGGGFQGYGQGFGNPMQNSGGFQSFGGQSFGGGNPWMRQQQSYGNKMGFQPQPWLAGPSPGGPGQGGMGATQGGGWNNRPMQTQPQTGGTFEFQEGARNFPRNDMRIPPGQQSFTPPPLGANEGMQVAPPMGTNSGITPDMIPPGAMQKPMAYGGDSLKGGNIYGPQGAMSPPGAYDAMVAQGQQEYDARMKMPAQFGRYADGSPREDPNALNARGQAHQGWYGGGWGR